MQPLSSDHTAIQFLRHKVLGVEPLKDFIGLRPDTLCNYKCVSCQQVKGGCEVSDKEWRALLERYGRPRAVCSISGGEPLLTDAHLDRVCRQVELSAAMGMFPCLFTNCHQLDSRQFERLMKAGLRQLTTAFYGANKEAHDCFRGRTGSFEAQYAALKMIGRWRREIRREFKFVVSVVIFRDNYRQLPEIVEMLGYIFGDDIDAIDFFPIKEYENLFLTADDVRFLEQEMLPNLDIRLNQLGFPSAARKLNEILEGDPTQGVYGEMPERCYSSYTSLYVCGRERKIYPCGYMADFAERHPGEAIDLGSVDDEELSLSKLDALPLPVCRKLCGPVVKNHNRRAGRALAILRGWRDVDQIIRLPHAENVLTARLRDAYAAMRQNMCEKRS